MIISNIKFDKTINTKQSTIQKNSVHSMQNQNASMPIAYPSNYYLSFGSKTRNVKTMYETFKDTEMPTTVKTYIEDLQVTSRKDEFEVIMSSPRLYQIQNAAFEQLRDCETIEDIQRTFPNEKYFKNLKKSTDVRPDGKGIFNLISKKQNSGKKVFDLDEDLTVYLVKRLFLECKSITDIQKELVDITFDDEIKSKIPRASIWCADTFAPLGIEIPDGTHYGSALLYSEDREYSKLLGEAVSRSWENLSPEEVTERIQLLLQGHKKEKYTMMDTWNKCIPIRQKLSEFLFENFDNEKYNQRTPQANYEGKILQALYKGEFNDKMRKLMNDFWRNNPKAKEELSVQVKESRRLYEEKTAQGPEALEKYIDSIINQSNVIRARLQEERERNRAFPHAKELIRSIARRTNRMYIKTPETNEDFYNILLDHFKNRELSIYEKSLVTNDKSSEFFEIFPPERQIAEAKDSLEYTSLLNAQIITILAPLLEEGKDIARIFECLQDKSKLDELIALVEPDCKRRGVYTELKQPLSQKDKIEVKEKIMQIAPQDDESFESNLDSFLDTQGKYLALLLSENKAVRTAVGLLALPKLDEHCGSSCVENFIKIQRKEEEQMRKIDSIRNINWSSIKAASWDV